MLNNNTLDQLMWYDMNLCMLVNCDEQIILWRLNKAVVSTPKHKYRASLQCERIGMILQGVLAEVFSECTVRI